MGSTLSYEGERWPTEIHFNRAFSTGRKIFRRPDTAFKENAWRGARGRSLIRNCRVKRRLHDAAVIATTFVSFNRQGIRMKRILAGLAFAAIGFPLHLLPTIDGEPLRQHARCEGAGRQGSARLYFNQDGTATRKLADGTEVKGTWKMDGAISASRRSRRHRSRTWQRHSAIRSPDRKSGRHVGCHTARWDKLTVTLQQGRP